MQFGDGRSISFGDGIMELFKGLIVISDVSLMMLLVVELHYITANCRLQGAIVVWEIGERKGLNATKLLAEP